MLAAQILVGDYQSPLCQDFRLVRNLRGAAIKFAPSVHLSGSVHLSVRMNI
jgi:hypothetical protein